MVPGPPREIIRGPGQRVKEGPQGQGGFQSESQLQPYCRSKTKKKIKGHYMLTMTIAAPHQPYLLIYKLATLLL